MTPEHFASDVPPTYGVRDLITYCPDPALLIPEVAAKFPERLTEENGYNVVKTPVQYSAPPNKATLALVRCLSEQDEAELRSLVNLEVLGTYEEVFADPVKRAKYESVYSLAPVEVIGEDGQTYTYIPPERFGEFA